MQFDGGTVARCQAGRHAVTADWRQGVGASILAREPGGPTWAKREQTRGALKGSGRFFRSRAKTRRATQRAWPPMVQKTKIEWPKKNSAESSWPTTTCACYWHEAQHHMPLMLRVSKLEWLVATGPGQEYVTLQRRRKLALACERSCGTVWKSCVWLHMAACGCMWLHVAACGCMWLHVAPCGSMRLRVAACGCVWLRVAACGCVWLRVAACGCVWLHVATCGCMWLPACGCAWPR